METIKPIAKMHSGKNQIFLIICTNFFELQLIVFLFGNFQELKESFNYGLFCPPSNGKAGKFLDEERRLGDYPFNGPVGYLEVGYFSLYIRKMSIQ